MSFFKKLVYVPKPAKSETDTRIKNFMRNSSHRAFTKRELAEIDLA